MEHRVPCNTLFAMKAVIGKGVHTKLIDIDKEFYYSTATDTLYSRDNPELLWGVECAGDHGDGWNCPVEHPERFRFTELGEVTGTALPEGAEVKRKKMKTAEEMMESIEDKVTDAVILTYSQVGVFINKDEFKEFLKTQKDLENVSS